MSDGQKEYQGGYVAVLHRLEEKFYGPNMRLSGNAMKVVLYIRHRLLRDWQSEDEPKPIGKSEILDATGLTLRVVERILKDLCGNNILLYIQQKNGKQWCKNSYTLHPEFVGTDFVFNGVKKPLRVIQGGKKSYPHKTKSYPQEKGDYRLNSRDTPGEIAGTLPANQSQIEHESDAKPSYKPISLNPLNGNAKSFTLSEDEIVKRNREKYFRDKKEMGLL